MGRLRGCLWLTAGLIVALVAGFVAYVALNRATTQVVEEAPETRQVSVVVAAQAVPVRAQLTEADLRVVEMAAASVPAGAVGSTEDAVGMVTLVDLYPDEVILAQRLVDPDITAEDGRRALILSDEQVLMALPSQDLLTSVKMLRPGDHIDILFSLDMPAAPTVGGVPAATDTTGYYYAEAEEEQATFSALENVVVAGITLTSNDPAEPGDPTAVLVAVSAQDALTLKYLVDAGGILDFVLRAPGVEDLFDPDPVDIDYVMNRYRIAR